MIAKACKNGFLDYKSAALRISLKASCTRSFFPNYEPIANSKLIELTGTARWIWNGDLLAGKEKCYSKVLQWDMQRFDEIA